MTDRLSSSDDVRNSNPLREIQVARFDEPLPVRLGGRLDALEIAYETWGELSPAADNAVLICHAISGDSHAARHGPEDEPGWWDALIGPGKAVDTNRLFVICSNVIGGCRGSTGPGSIDPATGGRYGKRFPTVTVEDMVDAQARLLDHLGIERLRAVVGGSLGGHQAIAWGCRYPSRVQTAVVIAASPRLTSQALAFEVVARNAIQSDPHYHNGDYYDAEEQPATGLAIARMLGHITYLSSEAMSQRFEVDRHQPRDIDTAFEKRFSVGSYLAHQGERFTARFDANSYCTISLALSLVDFGGSPADLERTLTPSECDWLVVSFSSDWLFPPSQSEQLVAALTALGRTVSYCEIPTDAGHDGFLLDREIGVYAPLVAAKLGHRTHRVPRQHPADDAILAMIPKGVAVLDLGCGQGDLLGRLHARGHRKLCGVDVGCSALISTAQFGAEVVDADLNRDLTYFHDDQFDVVVVSSTLQEVSDVRTLLDCALRIGSTVIVSFANFGYAPLRKMLAEDGRSPKTKEAYSYEWYETPNRRFATILDVLDLLATLGAEVLQAHYHASGQELSADEARDPNLHAEGAVLKLRRISAGPG